MLKTLHSFLKSVGKNISGLRRSSHLNQTDAAEKVGISYRYYQEIENGRANMTLSTIFRLATFFRVSPAKIVRTPEG